LPYLPDGNNEFLPSTRKASFVIWIGDDMG